jgi:hypothetical protein
MAIPDLVAGDAPTELLHLSFLESAQATAAQLASAYPVSGVALAEQVLSPRALEALRVAVDSHEDVRPFCVYSTPEEPRKVKAEFRELDGTELIRSYHQRPFGEVPQLLALKELLATPELLDAFRRISGLPLQRFVNANLAYWGPGSFTTPHNDYGNGTTQLVMVVSLTDRWRAADGGMTKYWDPGAGGWLGYLPRLNTAVLLRPSFQARHWVEKVSRDAPTRRRVTLTVGFQ